VNPEFPKLSILASGRGSNCEALLRAAASGELPANPVLVLSDNPDAPVLDMARSLGVEAMHIEPGRPRARLTPEQEERYVEALRDRGTEWIALAGFMRILGPGLLRAFAGRILNIHPSLLPSFPGLDGVGQAWRAGVQVAGCTVHFVDEGVDTGPIVAQTAISVLPHDTEDSLRSRVLEQEHATYVQAVTLAVTGCLRIEGRRVHRVSPV